MKCRNFLLVGLILFSGVTKAEKVFPNYNCRFEVKITEYIGGVMKEDLGFKDFVLEGDKGIGVDVSSVHLSMSRPPFFYQISVNVYDIKHGIDIRHSSWDGVNINQEGFFPMDMSKNLFYFYDLHCEQIK